jgi:tRNA(Ile)-lysidine synthase
VSRSADVRHAPIPYNEVVLEIVADTISRRNMLAAGDRVIVAVSGGADSVCLLEALLQLEINVSGVAHFNHKLRGEASDADERFVEQLASDHGLPFFRGEFQAVPGNFEQAAREARRSFFRGLIASDKADRIATGHTLDDQAETVLFRITRGVGLAGLAGILPVTQEGLIRPLLDVTRAQIVEFLNSQGVRWREDQTNYETRFTRNRIRHELLPTLARDYNPRIAVSLAHMAELARDEEAWWSAEVARKASEMLTVSRGSVEMRAEHLAHLPKALARRMIREAIRTAKGDLRQLEFQHVEKVLELAVSGSGTGKARLPGITVTRSLDWIRLTDESFAAAPAPFEIQVPGAYAWAPTQSEILLEVAERKGRNVCDTLKVELRWDRVAGPLELRGWKSGDAYCPQGLDRTRRLKELFQDFRVPSWRRAGWPIISYTDAGGNAKILWAKSFGPARDLVPEDGYSGPVLLISEHSRCIREEKPESFASEAAS